MMFNTTAQATMQLLNSKEKRKKKKGVFPLPT
jgi:hypothetical protein